MNKICGFIITSAVVLASPATAQAEKTLFSMKDLPSFIEISFGISEDATPKTNLEVSIQNDAKFKSRTPFISSKSRDRASSLRDLIGYAEAYNLGYDAVHYGARTRPYKRPSEMTLDEIFAWIGKTPGQPHAIGRYQFIPSTLASLVRREGISHAEIFSPKLQDRLANILLLDAGFEAFVEGQMSAQLFMYNLAGIWAGLPLPSGHSRYEGYAGNRATISWETYHSSISQIFGYTQ